MPNTGEYHIKVSFDSEPKSPVAGAQEKSYAEKSSPSLEKGVKGLVSFGAIKSTASTLIGHQINTIELRTGAREYEQRVSYLVDRTSEAISTGGLVLGGIATGNIGIAAVGVVTMLANKLLNIGIKAHTLSLQTTLENMSISLATIRAGAGNRRSMAQ